MPHGAIKILELLPNKLLKNFGLVNNGKAILLYHAYGALCEKTLPIIGHEEFSVCYNQDIGKELYETS